MTTFFGRARTAVACLVATCGVCALLPSAAMAAKRTVPQGWLGVNVDPWNKWMWGLNFVNENKVSEFDRMADAGVETIRFPLYWSRVQPYASVDACLAVTNPVVECSRLVAGDGPASDAPYYWDALDAFVSAAAARGIELFPNVMTAPLWAASPEYPPYSFYNLNSTLTSPIPADDARFARFVAALVRRYGPHGSLWAAKPAVRKTPIKVWQIWNEPDLRANWPEHLGDCVPRKAQQTTPTRCPAVSVKVRPSDTTATTFDLPTQTDAQLAYLAADRVVWPAIVKALTAKGLVQLGWAPSFLSMLKQTRAAVAAADPDVSVSLPSLGAGSAPDLDTLYRAGGKGSFDAISANLFVTAAKVISAAQAFRKVAAAHGDANLPIYVAEFSWSSGKGWLVPGNRMDSIVTDRLGQAKNLGASVKALSAGQAKNRIAGAFWFTWASRDASIGDVWEWTGLNTYNNGNWPPLVTKPSLSAYRSWAMKLEGCAAKVVAWACSR